MTNDIIRHDGNGAMALADTMTLAETFVRSGFFSDARDASQAVVKILAGRELGFGPMASMTGVYIVKGKVSMSANLLAAAIKRSGRYNYTVADLSDARCSIEFTDGGKPCGPASTFTIEDAKAAGLTSNETWRKFPRNMLFARALSNGARWYCPDVFGGPLYTPDELGATVDGETGEVIDVTPVVASAPATPAREWAGSPPEMVEAYVAPEDVADRATPPPADAAVREDAKGTGVRGALEACDGPGAMLDLLGRIDAIGQSHHRHNGLKLWAAAIIGTGSVEHMILASEVVSEWPADKPSRDYLISAFKAGVDGAAVPA